jgi:hypothetical protein
MDVTNLDMSFTSMPCEPAANNLILVPSEFQVAGSNPGEVDFFNLLNPSSRTMGLGSTQPLTEISTRNISGGNGQPARKADNLTAICEPIV